MKKILNTVCIMSLFVFFAVSTTAFARSVYLNGIDISSTKNQSLKNVNIQIGEDGSLFIEAPHYQVNEESTYTPISGQAKQRLNSRNSDANLTNTEVRALNTDLSTSPSSQDSRDLREKAGIKLEN
jgi:biopolymer transport protein ExbD